MNLLKWLKRPFKKPAFIWPAKDIEFAFTCGGVDYYNWRDINNIPALRGLMAYTVTNELTMRVDRDYLLQLTEAIDGLINSDKPIKKTVLAQFNLYLKERLNFVVETELLYKLASIVFFDRNENIYEYDFGYAQRKINAWKKEDVNLFFSTISISKLINYEGISELDLKVYSETIERVKRIHMEFLSELKFNSNSTTSNAK